MVAVRSCWKLLPYLSEPMPDGYKTDPPLAKYESIRDGSNDSVITSLRRKELVKTVVKHLSPHRTWRYLEGAEIHP